MNEKILQASLPLAEFHYLDYTLVAVDPGDASHTVLRLPNGTPFRFGKEPGATAGQAAAV